MSYKSISARFVKAWNDGKDAAERAENALIEMLETLQGDGLSRTEAINKIANDHTHLKGFSRRSIYYALPAEEKRLYLTQPKPKNRKKSNVQELHNSREESEDSTDDEARTPNPVTQASQTAEAGSQASAPATSGLLEELETLKRENHQLKEAAAKTAFVTADKVAPESEELAKVKARLETVTYEVAQLRQLLTTFKAGARLYIRDQTIPLIIEVDPQSKRILNVSVLEAEARRMNAQ